MTSPADLEALERRLRGMMLSVTDDAADALAVVRQERTQLQGLIETWQAVSDSYGPLHPIRRIALKECAGELQAVLSGSVVSPEAQDQ